MEFHIPVKYLYEHGRIVDKGLLNAIFEDLDMTWTQFPEEIDGEEQFLELIENAFPEGSQNINEGILQVVIYDYYDHSFSKIPSYCEKNKIPLNLIEEPEFSGEQTYMTFYRPDRERICVPVDEGEAPLVQMSTIMLIINNSDEDLTDTEVMTLVSNRLDELNPYSEMNTLQNWV